MVKKLIVLRPQPNQDKTNRVGLYKSEDTVNRTHVPVKSLLIDLRGQEIVADENMLQKYNEFGSLIDDSIHAWVLSKQYENKENLLFEWYNENKTDYYRFVGSENEISILFREADKKKRKRRNGTL